MGMYCIRDLYEDIGVEAVRIENVVILDCHCDDAAAYLILRNLDAQNLLVRERQLGYYKHVAVFLLEPLSESEGVSRSKFYGLRIGGLDLLLVRELDTHLLDVVGNLRLVLE